MLVVLALFPSAIAEAEDVEVIEDETSTARALDAPPEPLSPAIAGGRMQSRALVDTSFDRASGEDVLEVRNRLDLHVEAPIAARIDARLAGRLDHRLLFAEEGDDRAAAEARLLEGWVDAGLGRLDLRIGQQVVAWGRVDVLPTADFLNPPDLTDGLATDLEPAVVPVPAIRADLAVADPLSLSLVYEPFFVPARVALFGSDFALVGPGSPPATRRAVARLSSLIDASIVEDVQDDLLATEEPDEWFVDGQVGGRVEAHGPEGAVAASAFWGFEKIPTIDASPELRAFLADPDDVGAELELLSSVEAGEKVYRSRYRRMAIVAIDGEMPAGPLLLRFDVGWTRERTLYYEDGADCSLPCALRAGVVQGAVQAEYTKGEEWLVTAELVVLHARRAPPTGAFVFFGRARTLVLGVAGVRRAFWDGDLELSAFGIGGWAPKSLVATVGASWRAVSTLRLEAGGLLFEGFGKGESPFASYDPNDAAYAGARYDF